MLSWLALLLTVLGAVAWGCAPVGWHKIRDRRANAPSVPRQLPNQQVKSIGYSSSRAKVTVRGRLADGELRPMTGIEIYVDASDCSLSLPIDTSTTRKPCQDTRVVSETDENGSYHVSLRVNHRQQRYLNVRFVIARKGHNPERLIIPLQSVDQMLGHMPVGSYYRLDRDEHRRLLSKRRDLVYTTSKVVMTIKQLNSLHEAAPFIHKNFFFSIADVVGGTLSVANTRCSNELSPAVHQNTRPIVFHFLFPRDWDNKNLLITGITSPICIELGNDRT